VLTIVSLLTFDDIGRALLPPAVYLLVNAIEGHVITPLILGKRFELHPVLIFVSTVFLGWAWGFMGALLAVPVLTIVRITAERLNADSRLARFLGP